MKNTQSVYVCSESADFRGFFVKKPKIKKYIKIAGFIQNQKGEKTFVKEDPISRALLESKSEFNFIKYNEVNDPNGVKFIEIKDFITVLDSDSSGNIVCGI